MKLDILISIFYLFIYFANGSKLGKVVIIGAGPVGLGSAMMLRLRGWSDITVLERRPESAVEAEKAYLYLIDGRGQRLTDLIGVTAEIAAQSVSSFDFKNLTEIFPDSRINVKNLPVLSAAKEKFWIPRRRMLECFLAAARRMGVRVLFDHKVESISLDKASGRVSVASSYKENMVVLDPSVLIGCDGYRSKVRDFLIDNDSEEGHLFRPVSKQSDSTGLKYKILAIRSDFPIPSAEVASARNRRQSTSTYAIRGTGKSETTRISLGLLPVKTDRYRTANIIAKPNHDIWKCRSVEDVSAFLSRSFPQLTPLSDYFPPDELRRFADASPGEFPAPSSTRKNQAKVSARCQVLLAGDTVHSFPPDLGQGVNSGLEDVYSLHDCLERSWDDIEAAAIMYEKERVKESLALRELMVFGYPYQYGHMPLKGKLALTNFAFRFALHKLLPSVFSPVAFAMVQDHTLKYSVIIARAHQTTRRILYIASAVLLALCRHPLRQLVSIGVGKLFK